MGNRREGAKMIGDFKGLLRSLNAYKAFAAYNMVLIHAVSIMHPILAPLGYVQNDHVRGSMLRGFFSMTLPVLAGFFMRHLLGPYLKNGKLTADLKSQLKNMILAVLMLEGIRLYTITFDIGWVFSWQVLHFIALSVIVTYFCLRRGTRFLLGFLVADILLAFIVPLLTNQLSASMNFPKSVIGLWFWLKIFSLGALLAWASWWWKRNYLYSLVSFLAGCGLMYFFGFGDPENLKSFILLPPGILSYVPGTRNYWPFLPFYPLFLAGFFFRSFFFDIGNRRWHLPITLAIAAGGILGGIVGFSGVEIGVDNAFNAEIFRRGVPGTLVFIAVFYFSWMGLYYLLRGHRFRVIDRFIRWGGNVLTLYLTHTILFVLLRECLTKNPQLVTHIGGLGGLYILLHLVYVLSVYLSYNLVKFFNSRSKVNR
jgi:hypothetical protein